MRKYMAVKEELESLGIKVKEYREAADGFGLAFPKEEGTITIMWPYSHSPVEITRG